MVFVPEVGGRMDLQRFYLRGVLDRRWFNNLVLLLIIVAVLIPGVGTFLSPGHPSTAALAVVSRQIVALFALEIGMRLLAQGRTYLRNPWTILDVIAVSLALVPGLGFMVVLRTFRLLRVLRVMRAVPELQRIADLLFLSLKTAASAMSLIVGIVYVEAVIVTELFGAAAPDYFGSIGRSVFTLIQLTTREGWPEIARLVMHNHPWYAIFFVGHVFASLLILLNVVGVLITETNTYLNEWVDRGDESGADQDPRVALLLTEIRDLRAAADRRGGRRRAKRPGRLTPSGTRLIRVRARRARDEQHQ